MLGYFLHKHGLVRIQESNKTWQIEELPMESKELVCMSIDPFNMHRMYVGTFNNGLWVSNDAGLNWTQAGEGIKSSRISAVRVSSAEQINGKGVVWAGTEPSEIYRSEDGGETWLHRPALKELPSEPTWSYPPRPHTHHVRWIEPDRFNVDRIFAGIELGGVMRSLDKGVTWEDRKPDSQHDCHTMATHPLEEERIYEAAGGGFAQSKDGGVTWQTDNEGLAPYHYLVNILVANDDPDCIIVSAARGAREAYNAGRAYTVVMKKTKGRQWSRVQEGFPKPEGTTITNFAQSTKEGNVFYAANNKGIFKSVDYGETWEELPFKWPEHYHNIHVKEFWIVA